MKKLIGKILWWFIGDYLYDELDKEVDRVTTNETKSSATSNKFNINDYKF